MSSGELRVALVVGTLARGGAEKQLVHLAAALRRPGIDVRLYSLTRGEFYESALLRSGITPEWIGQRGFPPARLSSLLVALSRFRPHVVQSSHFFGNLYAGLAARWTGALGLGAVRNDGRYEVEGYPGWGRALLRAPQALVTNSFAAKRNLEAMGLQSANLHVLHNVIDLGSFDRSNLDAPALDGSDGIPVAIVVARHAVEKRLEMFIQALALARADGTALHGLVVGDGPARAELEARAEALGLRAPVLRFLGQREDVPGLLRRSHLFVLPSRHEGFPNVILEAMAARLPVVSTAAGDAGVVVREGETGFVVPFDDPAALADRMRELARMSDLRHRLGNAGRRRVEDHYAPEGLCERMLAIYRAAARRESTLRLLAHLT